MNYKGKIKNLNHVVVSDPMYDEKSWGRYEIKDLHEKDWLVELKLKEVKSEFEDGAEFDMVIKKHDYSVSLAEEGIEYIPSIKIKQTTIGMDSACIALGINEYAKQIAQSQDEWQPHFAIRTGGDGIFGGVVEGRIEDELQFIYINGYISLELDYDMESLRDYLIGRFEVEDLLKEVSIDNSELEGDI